MLSEKSMAVADDTSQNKVKEQDDDDVDSYRESVRRMGIAAGVIDEDDEEDDDLQYDSDDVMQAEVFRMTVRELLYRRATYRPEWASEDEAMAAMSDDEEEEDDEDEEKSKDDNDEDDSEEDDDTFFARTTPPTELSSATANIVATTLPGKKKKTKKTSTTALRPELQTNVSTINRGKDPNQVRTSTKSITDVLRLPTKGDDVFYSFERYKGAEEWGNNAALRDDDVVEVKEYKQRQDKSSENPRKDTSHIMSTSFAATTGGAKLVEYLEQRRVPRRPLCVSTRYDAGIRQIPKAGEESVAMTLGNGTRVHVRIAKVPTIIQEQATGRTNILGLPMSELMRRSQAIQKASILRKHISITNQSTKELERSTEDDEEHQESNDIHHSRNNNYLWVDRHAPTSFSHLLSDESINREVLRALRAWDPYVFRRAPPKQKQYGNNNHNIHADEFKKKSHHDMRPDERNRVILLSGPPGVGKTTLAHILAKHAGYRPMEVNASDERSATVLKERVLQAMESTTLQFAYSDQHKNAMVGRPNCLILDEIDGADVKGAISALVEIIRAELPCKSTTTTTTTKGNKQKKPFLRRPMIFICNHKYAPALRPLLPYCRHFDVSPPSSVRLVARLRAILNAEHVTVGGSSNMLNQLVVSSGGDIRSCLYTLQFASARAKETVTTTDATCVDIAPTLASSVGGSRVKDARNDVANIITSVFRKWKESQNEEKGAFNGKTKTSYKASVDRVMDLVKSFDDHTKTLDGMFMNVMRVSYIDPTLDRCAAAHEWMSGADMFRSWRMISSDGGYSMQSWHIPSSAAAIHLMCRVETRSDLTFSTRELSDLFYQHEANAGLAQRFLEGCSIRARTNMRMSCLVTETIPYALWMLSAGEGSCSLNRPASSIERLSASELHAFHSHVSTLLSLGLKYVSADESTSDSMAFKSPAATVQLRLDPPIDKLICFSDLNVSPYEERKPIPASLKELLAQHSAQESIRDHVAANSSTPEEEEDVALITQSPPAPTRKQGKENQEHAVLTTTAKIEPAKAAPIHKVKSTSPPRLEPAAKRAKTLNFLGAGAAKVKAARTAKRVAKAGFSNTLKSAEAKLSHTGSGVPLQQVIRFKYQKGFTQAVRAPCRLEDLVG